MTKLGQFLQRHFGELERGAHKKAAKSLGIMASLFSRLYHGKRRVVDPATLETMMKSLKDRPDAKMRLICAYLEDQCPKDYADLVRVQPATYQLYEESPSYGDDPVRLLASFLNDSRVSPKLAECLKKLAVTAADCPELHRVLEDLTKLSVRSKKMA